MIVSKLEYIEIKTMKNKTKRENNCTEHQEAVGQFRAAK